MTWWLVFSGQGHSLARCPDWYLTWQIAKALHQTPETIEAMSLTWYERAAIALSAEAEAEAIIARRQQNRSRR